MIVQCNTCGRRYHLDASALGARGSHVRCTACQSVWFQDPPAQKNPVVMYQGPVIDMPKKRSWLKRCLFLVSMVFLCVGVGWMWGSNAIRSAVMGWIEDVQQLVLGREQTALELMAFSFERKDSGGGDLSGHSFEHFGDADLKSSDHVGV
jgi:predicted Zn finger-like uncharacterized protein